jgi:diguanylate cyclase (GGDEF)-like protein
MRNAIAEGRECRVTLLNFRRDRTPFWCEVHLAPVRDALGRVVQYVGVQNDVSDRVRAEMQLREQRDRADHLARYDLLTGLPNRQEFSDRAEASLDRLTENETAALVFIDIDRFKRVNDRYGHKTGDDVLRDSANELLELCGPDVLVARHAGDEFVAFFTSADARVASRRADLLVRAISESLVDHVAVGVVTASAGASLSTPEERLTLDQMLARADAAMYANKRSRREPPLTLHRVV